MTTVKPEAVLVPPTQEPRPHSATPTIRRIPLDLEVEVLTDADTGIPELIVNNDVVTARQARDLIAEAARDLVGMCQIISDYEDTVYDATEADALIAVFEAFLIDSTAQRPQPGLVATGQVPA